MADQRQVFDKESESLVINTLMHFKKQVKTSKFLANILGLITSSYRSPCGIMKAAILRSTGYDLDTNGLYRFNQCSSNILVRVVLFSEEG